MHSRSVLCMTGHYNFYYVCMYVHNANRLEEKTVECYTLCHPGLTYIFNFWHSGTLALSPERQSARMSEIKNV